MPPAVFEPATPASDRPQTLALDSSATGIGKRFPHFQENSCYVVSLLFATAGLACLEVPGKAFVCHAVVATPLSRTTLSYSPNSLRSCQLQRNSEEVAFCM